MNQITMKKLEDPMGPVKKPNQTMNNQMMNRTDQLTQDMFVKETAMKNNANVVEKSSIQKIN